MNISRQKLIDKLKHWHLTNTEHGVTWLPEHFVAEAIEALSQPPADRPEPKRGKWIRYEDTHENSVKYICPFCGDYTAFRGEIAESTVNGNYIYCRHCGAKNGEDQ